MGLANAGFMRKYLFPVAVVLAWSIAQAALSAFDATDSEVAVSASAETLNGR